MVGGGQKEDQQQEMEELCRLPPLESAPWLVIPPHGNSEAANDLMQTFFSLSEDKCYVGRALYDEKLYDCCKASSLGWLMILDSESNQCFLLDPITTERIELPPLPFPLFRDYFKFVLSLPPTDPECRILCACFRSGSIAICHLHPAPGHNCTYWMKHNYEADHIKGPLSDVVACKGVLYGLTGGDNLAVIDFEVRPRIQFLKTERDTTSNYTRLETDILESCGELFCVVSYMSYTRELIDIRVWKLKEGRWVVVNSIGGRVFLLSSNKFSASCSGEAMRIKGNRIYFVNNRNNCLHVFDLEARTISTQLIFSANKRSRMHFQPFWLIPAATAASN